LIDVYLFGGVTTVSGPAAHRRTTTTTGRRRDANGVTTTGAHRSRAMLPERPAGEEEEEGVVSMTHVNALDSQPLAVRTNVNVDRSDYSNSRSRKGSC